MSSEELRDQQLAALFARTSAGIRPGLGVMREWAELLDHPQDAFLSVHVAGTNGKGSTCALLASALQQTGLKTGLFTSPHLIKVNERIQIGGTPVSDDTLFDVLEAVQAAESRLSRPATFFETLTMMAFLAFAREGVQVAVLETGLGGRLDCTNIVHPLLSVITRVDYDHMGFLGNTLTEIAGEKAGIIKPGRPVVMGEQAVKAAEVIRAKAGETGSLCIEAAERVSLAVVKQDLDGQRVRVSTLQQEVGTVQFPLLGGFQVENLCTAIAAMECLQDLLGLAPPASWISDAVSGVSWPARGQVLCKAPPLLLDVAHNAGGAKALKSLLQSLFGKQGRGVLFWAGMRDKPNAEFIHLLRPVLQSCICMDLQTERALPASELCLLAGKEGLPARVLPLARAREAQTELCSGADFGCVAGSVYLAGEWLANQSIDKGEGMGIAPS